MKRILISETIKHIGEKVKVCGWVDTIRSHGKIVFIDLRDKQGILQLVFTPKNKEIYKIAKELKPEWVVLVEGSIGERPKNMINPKIKTGEIELGVEKVEVFSRAKTLPFPIDTDGYEINEEIRMKYRYLDLRRQRLKENLKMRQKTIQFMRDFLIEKGFLEVETPILTKSTPEGARDFLVPSRTYPGNFYALPQSPQQYKQLLMVAGIEKYFQIARCFRDEDPRGDRQAEFTQLDIEMSFVGQDDILNLIEELFTSLVKKLFPKKKITKSPFPRITYKQAMEKYSSDKPDLRKNKKDDDELAFGFVVDFPLFEWKESEKRLDAVHHPFTRPQEQDISKVKKNAKDMLAYQYDLVLNGYEIGGGSLRIYDPKMLETIFEIMGHKKEGIRKRFGHLLKAFEYGVPPHGGIAPGIDRFVAIVQKEPNIREVIAFPKTGENRGMMMDTPSEVSKEQLKDLKIQFEKKKESK
ncbi:MAG: aspartate--tRNA ligase [Patescibacteria group bacterium]|nr:aspartate--tRNA ligase [Patescibacteria group bacterium]